MYRHSGKTSSGDSGYFHIKTAGDALKGKGGNVSLISGFSESASSGSLTLTWNGQFWHRWRYNIWRCDRVYGNHSCWRFWVLLLPLRLEMPCLRGKSGDIRFKAGVTFRGPLENGEDGAEIGISAGDSTDQQQRGGSIVISFSWRWN